MSVFTLDWDTLVTILRVLGDNKVLATPMVFIFGFGSTFVFLKVSFLMLNSIFRIIIGLTWFEFDESGEPGCVLKWFDEAVTIFWFWVLFWTFLVKFWLKLTSPEKSLIWFLRRCFIPVLLVPGLAEGLWLASNCSSLVSSVTRIGMDFKFAGEFLTVTGFDWLM